MQDESLQPVQQPQQAQAGAALPPNLLHEEYTIDTPENVTFGYGVAGIGSRFIGALIDTSLLALLLLLLNLAVWLLLGWLGENAPAALDAESGGSAPDWVAGLLIALYALVNFGLIWGYYLLFELLWNGQTPGKRLARTQVVQADGSPAGFTDIAIRNLVRIVDFLPFAYGLGLVVMFSNRRARRLGDFAADTLVIRRRETVKLADLARTLPPTAPVETAGAAGAAGAGLRPGGLTPEQQARFPMLQRISAEDYRLACDVLARRAQGGVDGPLLRRVAVALAARSGASAPAADALSTRQFLSDLIEAYRANMR